MKNFILLASFLTAGVMSAGVPPTKNTQKKLYMKRGLVSLSNTTKSLKNKAAIEYQCATVVVSCTSAYTCQDWSMEQWANWGSQIQSNYCMIDSPYTP